MFKDLGISVGTYTTRVLAIEVETTLDVVCGVGVVSTISCTASAVLGSIQQVPNLPYLPRYC